MIRLLALLIGVFLGALPAAAQAPLSVRVVAACGTVPVAYVAGSNNQAVMDVNGNFCVGGTVTITPSGTQTVNIGQILGAAVSITNPLFVSPATGATWAVTQSTSPWVVSNGGTFAVQAAQAGTWTVQPGNTANTTAWLVGLNSSPSIANGNGVVPTPTTEAGSAVAPSTAVSTAESCRVLQASAANLYSLMVAIGATTGYVMIFNATSAPVDGAVSPAWPAVRVVSDGTSGWAAMQFNPPLRLGTGATVCFSSTGPFTKTASATAAIGGQVK